MTKADVTLSSPDAKPRRNNLNFLRVLLATLVIFSHSPEIIDGDRHREALTKLFHTLSFGELAVDGFFIISGYLIVQSWLRSTSVWDYLRKRVLRIYPGFIAAFLFSVLIIGALGARDAQTYFAQTHWRQMLVNLATLTTPKTAPTFVGMPYPGVNEAMWTIVYEFGCYLIIILLGLTGLINKRFTVAMMFVIVLLAQLYVEGHRIRFATAFYFFGDPLNWPRFLTFFLAGCCSYLYRDRIIYRSSWAWFAVILLFLAMFHHVSANIFLPLCGTYLLLYIGLNSIEALSKIGTRADLSYGLYLYAWPVQTLLVWHFRSINPWLLSIMTFMIACCFAWLSWHLVEKPGLSLKRAAASAH